MDSTEIQGSIERITFFNEENNYGVIKILAEGNYPEAQSPFDGTVTVTGIMPRLVDGETVAFTGSWKNHPTYGMQFEATDVKRIGSASEEGIIRYLSDTVRGIGPVSAKKIVDYYGKETMSILDSDPEAVHKVPELKPKLADNLVKVWGGNKIKREAIVYLRGYGVSKKFAQKIYDTYGYDTIHTIEKNPYLLSEDLSGVGFKKADAVAQSVGIKSDSPERIRAGLIYALQSTTKEGHTFAPSDYLIEKTFELLNVSQTPQIGEILEKLVLEKKVWKRVVTRTDGAHINAIYLPVYFHSETGSAKRLKTIANTSSDIQEEMSHTDWESFLNGLATQNNVSLSQQQQSAVQGALLNKISVLTGGPGTGKTTTLQMLINALEQKEFDIKLASPTGRAAKRLSEATGYIASTIHRLLGYSPHNDGFLYDEDDPLNTDMVIIDESSMIDILLFYNLLKALKPSTHLMLVGDVDQLPSVGAGNVLYDVIDSGIAHVTRLDEIFRQSEDSQIVTNAHRINHGVQPITDNSGKDFFFFNKTDPEQAKTLLVEVVKTRIQQKFGKDKYDPVGDIQVIAPMYRGPAGVHALNKALQRALNSGSHLAEIKLGDAIFRHGDKVMQTKNNYEKDVFNGDIGRIQGIDGKKKQLRVYFDKHYVDYDFEDLDESSELIHAYCITIHRSQGSEYPVVVMPLLKQHYMMLQRNLLYTAVTRARDVVVLVGDRQAMYMAVQNNKVTERYSGLADYLRSGVQESPRLL